MKSNVCKNVSKGIVWPAGTRTWRELSTTESGSLLKIIWTVYMKLIFVRQEKQISYPGASELNTAECLNIGVLPNRV